MENFINAFIAAKEEAAAAARAEREGEGASDRAGDDGREDAVRRGLSHGVRVAPRATTVKSYRGGQPGRWARSASRRYAFTAHWPRVVRLLARRWTGWIGSERGAKDAKSVVDRRDP